MLGNVFPTKTLFLSFSTIIIISHSDFLHLLMTKVTRNITLLGPVCFPWWHLWRCLLIFSEYIIALPPPNKIQNYWSIYKYLWWRRGLSVTLQCQNLTNNHHIWADRNKCDEQALSLLYILRNLFRCKIFTIHCIVWLTGKTTFSFVAKSGGVCASRQGPALQSLFICLPRQQNLICNQFNHKVFTSKTIIV